MGILPVDGAKSHPFGIKPNPKVAGVPADLLRDGKLVFMLERRDIELAFKAAKTNAVYGTSLLLAYGVGHCAVIVLAGTFTEVVQRFLNWNEQSKGVTILKCVCGVLVLLGGVWLIYSAP